MAKHPSEYHRPKELDEALRLLARPDTVPLAGGTALLAGDITSAVVDLQDLGLNQIAHDPYALHAGAMVRLTDLAEFLAAENSGNTPSPLLQKAVHQAGPNTIRNAATIGGVIASRPADSELLATLLVLDTRLILHRTDGQREMALTDYLAPAERPTGLITDVIIPWIRGQGASHRVARTPADYPIVSVTAWTPVGGTPRLAATGIDERPLRLTAAEAALAAGINEKTIAEAAAAAQAASRHPGDFRGDAAYRGEMAAVLTRRALTVSDF